jgi:hypothetical protein
MSDHKIFHIYCDESSVGAHHYMAVGATFCRKDAAQEIAAALADCVARNGGREGKELRWNNLTKFTLPMYADAIGTYMEFTKHRNRRLRYRALVVDNHKLVRTGDRDEILAKFIFTLVFGFARSFGPKIKYYVWLDERSSADSPKRTLYSLNNKAKTKFSIPEGPFQDVRFVSSKDSKLIQGTDLITGAIAYETNQRHTAKDAAPYRIELLRHAVKCAGLETLARPTSRWPFNFQIGHFDFDKSKLRLHRIT